MNSESPVPGFAGQVLEALGKTPILIPQMGYDTATDHNAAACLTEALSKRLPKSERQVRNTFEWSGGLCAIKNFIPRRPQDLDHWSAIHVNAARKLHQQSLNWPIIYLFTLWFHGTQSVHTWAVPEAIVYEPLDTIARGGGTRYEAVISPRNNQLRRRFKKLWDDSVDVTPFYRLIKLEDAEFGILQGAFRVDANV